MPENLSTDQRERGRGGGLKGREKEGQGREKEGQERDEREGERKGNN